MWQTLGATSTVPATAPCIAKRTAAGSRTLGTAGNRLIGPRHSSEADSKRYSLVLRAGNLLIASIQRARPASNVLRTLTQEAIDLLDLAAGAWVVAGDAETCSDHIAEGRYVYRQ